MPKTKLDLLKRKPVEIRADGLTYRGVLLEATESEVTIKSRSGYISIPMEKITSVIDPSQPLAKGGSKFIDESFYSADLTPTDPKPEE